MKALPRKLLIGGQALLVAENELLMIKTIRKIFSLSPRTFIPTLDLFILRSTFSSFYLISLL